MKIIWRIADGDFQAFGFEHGGDARPVLIAKYYFSKTAEVDWDRETVEALGKKFYEVRIQGEEEQEPPDEPVPSELDPEPYVVDPREISAQRARERLTLSSPTSLETFDESDEMTERETRPTVEILPSVPKLVLSRERPTVFTASDSGSGSHANQRR